MSPSRPARRHSRAIRSPIVLEGTGHDEHAARGRRDLHHAAHREVVVHAGVNHVRLRDSAG